MKLIKVDSIKTGDILAQSLITENGVVLLGEGLVLSVEYISKIKESGFTSIYIEDNLYSVEETTYADFTSVKENGINIVSNIYQKVINFENIEVTEITPLVEDVLDFIKNGNNIPPELMNSIKLKDDYTYVHSINTCFFSILLGEYLNLNEDTILKLGVGALLHDIGKTKIRESILKKQDKLSFAEYEEMKLHAAYGYEILKNINGISEESAIIALNHHEKFDGTGYPSRLTGNNIDFLSQIVSVCDVYDALINVRSYKRGFKPNDAFDFILSKTGTYFNIDVVKAFRDCVLIYPDGIGVKLSDGRLGFVEKQNKGFPERPVVNVVTDSEGNFTNHSSINLMKCLNIIIDDIIL